MGLLGLASRVRLSYFGVVSTQELGAPVQGDAVDQLADWASLWADLLHVDMTLHARSDVPADAGHLFMRRALWEAAVISYGRTANTGRRRQRVTDLVSALGVDAEECHRDVMAWRNRHVAHRVDHLREAVEVDAIVDPAEPRLKRLNVRVAPALGPEEEDGDLIQRFTGHVKALRNRVWEENFRRLEQAVLEDYADRAEDLLTVAKPLMTAQNPFAIDINPSGRS
jgi:hypothetical protein